MDNKIPDKVSFYDMCKKPGEDKNEVIELTIWPEGVDVPPQCRRNPESCGIERQIIQQCHTSMNPLDFVYETSQKDYVLYNYKTDEQLVQKI